MLDSVLENLPGSHTANCLCEFSTAQQFTVLWNMIELDVLSICNRVLDSIVNVTKFVKTLRMHDTSDHLYIYTCFTETGSCST